MKKLFTRTYSAAQTRRVSLSTRCYFLLGAIILLISLLCGGCCRSNAFSTTTTTRTTRRQQHPGRLFSSAVVTTDVGTGLRCAVARKWKSGATLLQLSNNKDDIDMDDEADGSMSSILVSRRGWFQVASALSATTAITTAAHALDIDSFVQNELQADNVLCNDKTSKKCMPKLSEDEALCRFGQPSPRTGEACLRAGMSTKRPSGGVDAFGQVDRGNYARCKPNYVQDPKNPGFLVNVWKCE
jgi:hypothetical protein